MTDLASSFAGVYLVLQFDRNLRTTHYPSFKAVKDATRVSHAGCPMNCHTYEIAVDTTTTGGESK